MSDADRTRTAFCPGGGLEQSPNHRWVTAGGVELDGVREFRCSRCPASFVALQVGLGAFLDQLREHIGTERVAGWDEGYRFGRFRQTEAYRVINMGDDT